MAKRINLDLSDECYQNLQELMEQSSKSMASIIREAVAFEVWLQKQQKSGVKILVEDSNGKQREVIRI